MNNIKTYDELKNEFNLLMENEDESELVYRNAQLLIERLESKLDGVHKFLAKGKKVDSFTKERLRKERVYLSNLSIRFHLNYGAYLKSNVYTDYTLLKRSFQKVLRLDRTNALAKYKMGFLHYKRQEFIDALKYFEEAIIDSSHSKYPLNSIQIQRAHVYKVNSSLKVIEQSVKYIREEEELSLIRNYPIASFFDILRQGEEYLNSHAFVQLNEKGKFNYLSRDAVENIFNQPIKTYILLFVDYEVYSFYNGKGLSKSLDIQKARVLRYLMLACTEQNPLTYEKYIEIFGSDVKLKTFQKNIERLRESFESINMYEAIITTSSTNSPVGYYFNPNINFQVIFRPDTILEHNYLDTYITVPL